MIDLTCYRRVSYGYSDTVTTVKYGNPINISIVAPIFTESAAWTAAKHAYGNLVGNGEFVVVSDGDNCFTIEVDWR
jgi:hypothetical protein